jgi:molybdopterin/thiamine biosynthesis adenylyltransferase
MQKYFKRQIQLWGEEKQNSLQNKKIAIVGAGGLGSSLCFALGASGIGEIHIIDFDEVSIHNIHRQIAFTLENEGKNKAKVNADLIMKRSLYTKAFAYEYDFKKWSEKNLYVDIIIDATDNLHTRAEIDKYAKEKNIPWVYGSVEAFNGQVCFFKTAKFEDFFKVIERTPAGIAAPIVMHIASLQANLAIRYLTGLSIKKDFVYYLYFNDEGELISQKFSIKT